MPVKSYHEVSFSMTGHGDPAKALVYRTHEGLPPAPSSTSCECYCRVDILLVPWNPSDVMTVQGRYASPYNDQNVVRDSLRQSPFFPDCIVAGSEGLGRVVEIAKGSNNDNVNDVEEQLNSLHVGDWVLLGQPGLGSMRSTMWIPAKYLLRLDRGEEFWQRAGPQACTLNQLGGTAIRMLCDYVTLQPGEVVLQNAGNSAVGYMVGQLARICMNVAVVSLVRKGSKTPEQWTELVNHLTENGKCQLVVAEEDLQNAQALEEFQSKLKQLGGLPRLALDAVGGNSASLLLSCLATGGTMVTYGGMSLQPISATTMHLIFQDLKLRGYWQGRWMVQHTYTERYDQINELIRLLLDEGLSCPPVQVFPLSQVKQAMEWETHQPSSLAIRRKLVWDCQTS